MKAFKLANKLSVCLVEQKSRRKQTSAGHGWLYGRHKQRPNALPLAWLACLPHNPFQSHKNIPCTVCFYTLVRGRGVACNHKHRRGRLTHETLVASSPTAISKPKAGRQTYHNRWPTKPSTYPRAVASHSSKLNSPAQATSMLDAPHRGKRATPKELTRVPRFQEGIEGAAMIRGSGTPCPVPSWPFAVR